MIKETRGRAKAAVLILFPFAVLGLATLAFWFGWAPDGRTNRGELLMPSVPLAGLQLSLGGESAGPASLRGRWGLIVLIIGDCRVACRDSLMRLYNLHLALDRDTPRLTRYYLQLGTDQALSPELQEWLERNQPGLQVMYGNAQRLREAVVDFVSGDGLLVDPQGNVILHYRAEQLGEPLLKDLRHLLKYSWIGMRRPQHDQILAGVLPGTDCVEF